MGLDDTTERRRIALRRLTARHAGRGLLRWVRSAPGTHVWLGLIAADSLILATAPAYLREFLLHHNSSNLMELSAHPVRVLVVSALWIQRPPYLLLYAALYELIHAPAERWLGTARWLAVAAAAHIGATLVSQRAVQVGIRLGVLPVSLAHTVDVGVSYGLAGVAGVLTYRLPSHWRWLAAAGLLCLFGFPLATSRTYTDLGHFWALLIGLACYRLTPARRGGGLAE